MDNLWAIREFLLCKEAEGKSRSIRDKYALVLSRLVQFAGGIPDTTPAVVRFLVDLQGEPSTRNFYFRLLRHFYNWLEETQAIPSPMRQLREPTVPEKIPPFLSLDEVRKLLNHPHPQRTSTVLRFLIDTGCRIGETANVDRSGLGDGIVLIPRGKTGGRIVGVTTETLEALHAIPVCHQDPDAVWCGPKGRLTVDAMKHLVARAMAAAGVPGSPKALRHTVGTHWSGGLAELQEALGHSNVRTTKRYSHYQVERIKRAHQEHGIMAVLAGRETLREANPDAILSAVW